MADRQPPTLNLWYYVTPYFRKRDVATLAKQTRVRLEQKIILREVRRKWIVHSGFNTFGRWASNAGTM